MFTLLWCLAIACGPSLQTDLTAPAYSKAECIAEATARLEREPQMMFICQEWNPVAQRADFDDLMKAMQRGEKTIPKPRPLEAVVIGPRTLSY